MTRFPITAIVLTRDEAANIRDCLACLDWAEDVIVVDSFSADDTVARAAAGRPDARVFSHPFRDFAEQRNWALDEAAPRHPWVLFVDADERITPACAEEIGRAVRDAGDRVGFFLCCRYFFLGRWIRHAGLYPSWQLRLLRKGFVRYVKEGHGQREHALGPLGYIREPYDHYGFSKGVAAWVARHNSYSSTEIDLLRRLAEEPLRLRDAWSRDPVVRRRCSKRVAARATPFRPWLAFFYTYVLRGGFLDGRPGLIFCCLELAHGIHIAAKMAETLHQDKSRSQSV
jgi:glycosyltransferase involved in cell wall biosynthesis